MPVTSRWMPLATAVVFALAVGGVSESVLGAVLAGLAAGALLRVGSGRVLPLAAAGAVFASLGTAASPRDADALALRSVPGGYALTTPEGSELFRAEGRGAKRACLRRAAAGGALRIR